MPVLTIFGIPKAFEGESAVIQWNAINSWKSLSGDQEVILFGDDPGVSEIATELDVRHFSEVERTEYGTPLLSDVFRKCASAAKHDILCYANADIIFDDSLVYAAEMARRFADRFLMVGRRIDLDVKERLDFEGPWRVALRGRVERSGRLAAPTAIDYFVFPRNLFTDMPDFAVGRPAWDAWLILRALEKGVPIIDATDVVRAVHQNHGYGHVPKARGRAWEGPEADRNRRLARESSEVFRPELYSVLNAAWRMGCDGIVRTLHPAHVKWRLREKLNRHVSKAIGSSRRERVARLLHAPRKAVHASKALFLILMHRPGMFAARCGRPAALKKMIRRTYRAHVQFLQCRREKRLES